MISERTVAYRGRMFTIAFARDGSGASPGEEFFDQLGTTDKAKLMQLFCILGDHGKHTNPEKFGDLGEGLFEFKSFQIRMPYAYAPGEKGMILITHGFFKKRNKAEPSQIERARKILQQDSAAAKIRVISDRQPKKRES